MTALVLAIVLFAQTLTYGQAYTTDGENNDVQFGLVTQVPSPDGSYLQTIVNSIGPDGTLGTQDCRLIVYRLMGSQPCVQNNGVCDINEEE